jgi:glycosyltransferase involved in cell wall biosynthesis
VFSQKNISDGKLIELRNKYHILENNIVISYLGSIGTWYMLDEMLDFFNSLLIQKPTAKFLFITPDEESVILKKALEKNIPKEQLIIYSANRSEVATYLALSQISIYFIKPVFSKKASSPTKTGEIMALGIPIITNSGIGDSDTILTDSGAGVLINDFNSIEYHRIISQIDVLLKSDNTNIKTAAVNYFSLEKGIELYDSVYQKLAKKLTND